MASCLAKRMHGKTATMVLMKAGNELDPVFDSLAPVITLTHALWDGWMPLATMAKCVRTAQLEQRENARPWTAVKGRLGQLWQPSHERSGRSSSMTRSCGACTMAASLTQRRKYRAAKTLSPLCAPCGSEEGSLIHRHFRCSEVQDGEPSNMLGPFHAAAQSGALWKHESFAARALLLVFFFKWRPPKYTVPYGTPRTGVVYGDGSAHERQDADLCVAGWVGGEHEHRAARHGPWNAAVPHPRRRSGRALRAVHVLAHQRGQTCGATSGARSMLGEACVTTSPCAR